MVVAGWKSSNLRWLYFSYTLLWLLLFVLWLRSALRHPFPLSILHKFLLLCMGVSIAAAFSMALTLFLDPNDPNFLYLPNSLFGISDFMYGISLTAVARGFGITHFSMNQSAFLNILCTAIVSFLPNSVCDLEICRPWVATLFKGCIVAWCIAMILDLIGISRVMNSAVQYMEIHYHQAKAITVQQRFGTLYAVLTIQVLILLTTYVELVNTAVDSAFSLSPVCRLLFYCESFFILFRLRPKIEDKDIGDFVQPHLPFALDLSQL